MENKKKKCSSKKHEEIDANSYCRECQIYICSKCEIIHSELCQKHQTFALDKIKEELFTGFCPEEKHNIELEFFCKTHNILCCAACLCKIKNKGMGQHKDCNVCNIEEIKKEKMDTLYRNIKKLKEFSGNLQELIDNLKKNFEKINEKKETLKLEIQKIFTKLRNELNEREDELIIQVYKQFDE